MSHRLMIHGVVCVQVVSSLLFAQQLPREQRGAPPVSVSHEQGVWIVGGRKNKVALNASDLATEREASVRQLDWPKEMDARDVNDTALSHVRGNLLEMTDHEVVDKSCRQERSTFVDGTTATIDRDARTFETKPALEFLK